MAALRPRHRGEVKEAYDILISQERKHLYDIVGTDIGEQSPDVATAPLQSRFRLTAACHRRVPWKNLVSGSDGLRRPSPIK